MIDDHKNSAHQDTQGATMRQLFSPVAISGAGPVGLAVALGLARAGVRSVVFEKKTHLDPHSRATLILPRT